MLTLLLVVVIMLAVIVSISSFKDNIAREIKLKNLYFQSQVVDAKEVLVGKSGSPLSASGGCVVDEDCYAAGCSNEVCTNIEGFMSTCELRDVPSNDGYSCGCIKDSCSWYK